MDTKLAASERSSGKTSMPKYRLTLMDKVNICLQSVGDYFGHLVITLDGRIDYDRFKKAVRLSLEAEPILACRYVEKWRKPYWERWSNEFLDNWDFCSLVNSSSPAQTEGILQDYFLEEMDPTHEPFINAKIIRAETDTICLKLNCVATDGAGLGYYTPRLFQIYNELKLNPGYKPRPTSMDIRSVKDVMRTLSLWDMIKLALLGARNHILNGRTKHNWEFPVKKGETIDRAFIVRQFDKGVFERLNIFRKKLGATVNDVMLAAYYRGLYKVIQPESMDQLSVVNTFDLRKHLKPEQAHRVANYSSYVNTNIQFNDLTPFEAVVRRVHDSMAEQKANYPGIVEAPYVWLIFKLLPFAWAKNLLEWIIEKRGDCVPVLTNAGRLDPEFVIVDGVAMRHAYTAAPLTYPPKLTTCLTTSGETITLTIGFSRSHFDKGKLEAMLDEMEQSIPHPAKSVAEV